MAQISVPAFALVMLIAVGLLTNEAAAGCCLRYSTNRPQNVIGYSIQNTKGPCNINAVKLLTAKNRMICVDPNQDWVIKIVATLGVRVISLRKP